MGTEYKSTTKIAQFIKWYKKNLYNENYPQKYRSPKEVINFIEKMAVWYELRYPKYEIVKMLCNNSNEDKDVTQEMFYNNKEINKILNNSNNKTNLNFSSFYNKEAFINSLPSEESNMLDEPSFPVLLYISNNCHIHFDEDGTISETEGLYIFTNGRFIDSEFVGKSAYNLNFILKKINLLPKINPLQKAIDNYDNKLKFKNCLLECVIYRIIERGGDIIGAKRALLFAEEFNLSTKIPVPCPKDNSIKCSENSINESISYSDDNKFICLSKPTNKIYYLKK